MNALEVHHIFPKALLYRAEFQRSEVNAVANFCFLTKDTNLQIRDRSPAEYFREIEARHPGALASQWIPMDRELWEVENYSRFLEERQRLLAEAANALLDDLLHDASTVESAPVTEQLAPPPEVVPGGIEDAEEEATLRALNEWLRGHGLPEGADRARTRARRDRRPARHPRPGLAERASGRLQRAGGAPAG